MASLGESWLDQLRSNSYRLTNARRAVVEVVANSERVLKPIEVYELAREKYPQLGLMTVYRTMEKLEELGLIQRVHQPQDCQAFVAALRGHHHLLLCLKCGRYEYFHGENLGDFFQDVSVDKGYIIKDHWMQLFGICRVCQERGLN